MQLSSTIYKVKTTTGGFFFDPRVPNGTRGILEEEAMCQLKKFCAKKEAQGNIITSVVELCAYNNAKPRVAFRDDEYRKMVQNLMENGSLCPWLKPGVEMVFFFRCGSFSDGKKLKWKEDFARLSGRVCTVMEKIEERDFCGPEPWSFIMEHGGLYGVHFEGEKDDYAVYGEELEDPGDCIEVVPGFYREPSV